MTKEEFAAFMEAKFSELHKLREAGQKEYAGGENAFGNFERLSLELGISREQVLWVYLTKHRDGIASYLRGHVSQREPVQGRIKDVIVYLMLLWAMVEDKERGGYLFVGESGNQIHEQAKARRAQLARDMTNASSLISDPNDR